MAISTNSSFVKLGKLIFWNLERNPTPNSCLLFAKAPLLGFWVAIIPKFGCILYFFKIFPEHSTLKILLSKACWIHSRTSLGAKLISSKRILCPLVYALKNWPSSTLSPEAELLSPVNFTRRSSIFVSALKLNLNKESSSSESLFNIFVIYSQAIKVVLVLEVPVGPSNKTGIPLKI